ncbi:Nucleoporin Nup43 [Blyttiomyces sp. JEL0837]|nr:Nucleoporin Nup43 [Blyttiomyces sp. JEL0837]
MTKEKEFDYFSLEGKISKVRFAPSVNYSNALVHFISGTYDEETPSLTLWKCPTTNYEPGTVPGPDASWCAEIAITEKYQGQVTDLTFCPERVNVGNINDSGVVFVSGSSKGHVSVYSLIVDERNALSYSGIKKLKSQQLHRHLGSDSPAACTAVAIQPNASSDCEIASVGEDGRICFSTLGGDIMAEIMNVDSSTITGMKWRTAHDVIVSTSAGRLKVVDRRQKKQAMNLVDLDDKTNPLNCVAVHPTQATRIATGSMDGTVKVWDLRSTVAPEIRKFVCHTSDVTEVMFHPGDVNKVVSCSEDSLAW